MPHYYFDMVVTEMTHIGRVMIFSGSLRPFEFLTISITTGSRIALSFKNITPLSASLAFFTQAYS